MMITTYRIGTLKLTEFKNEKSNGYKIEKSYKDKQSGEWKDTTNLFFEDLLKLKSLIAKIENETVISQNNTGKDVVDQIEDDLDSNIPF